MSEFLYPVASRRSEKQTRNFQTFHLLEYDFGAREKGSDNEFMLFPLVFYGQHPQKGNYFALFPVGGEIYGRFWRDEIRFALFPLYGQTVKKETTTTNVLWPIFSLIRGEQERGWKVWPLAGSSEKEGAYRKRFFLWPIFFRYDLGLDTDTPHRRRAVFPFYVAEESPVKKSTTFLWPFFSHRQDLEKGYEEWNAPWPLVRISRGAYKEGTKLLPLYADEKIGSNRKRWFLWPLYKIEELETELIERRRDRILFFLFSSLTERRLEESAPPKRRVSLWPLFSYERNLGVSRFNTLAVLDPFFPENAGFERSWSPLWRLYQHKWDSHGNEVSSLLWNLYWKERRGNDLAMEVFPFFRYLREEGAIRELSLLKGFIRYRRASDGNHLDLFFTPWGPSWIPDQPEAGG